ncbi:hypothetical protein WT49_04255 [Burkholderia territorii]|nr:hypothetical protein WT50_29595 [Burkholderia territorii]KWE42147.1 hypothetical protein WT49_04255 [Burkholderia territorii]
MLLVKRQIKFSPVACVPNDFAPIALFERVVHNGNPVKYFCHSDGQTRPVLSRQIVDFTNLRVLLEIVVNADSFVCANKA